LVIAQRERYQNILTCLFHIHIEVKSGVK
jgi:hypothetical protein